MVDLGHYTTCICFSVDFICSDAHRLLQDMGYHPSIESSAYSMLLALFEFKGRQHKPKVVMRNLQHCTS